jgi:hypothetical protein
LGDWILSRAVSTAGGPILHPTIHFLNKNIKIVMKIKGRVEISQEKKMY